jgi:hypothetical protein
MNTARKTSAMARIRRFMILIAALFSPKNSNTSYLAAIHTVS